MSVLAFKPPVDIRATQEGRETARLLSQRLSRLETLRQPWLNDCIQLARYVAPNLGRFQITNNDPQRLNAESKRSSLVDNTSIISHRKFSAGMMSGMSSPSLPWFTLQIPDLAGRSDDARQWLDDTNKLLFRVLAESNFYRSLATMYDEIGCFGTAAMIVDEDFKDVVRFYPMTAGEYCLSIDDRMETSACYRQFTMTAEQIMDRFGVTPGDDIVGALLQSNSPDQELIVAQGIYRNTRYIPNAPGTKGMPWRSVYWIYGNTTALLEDKGYWEKPFCAPRWAAISNDVYGTGPAMDALGDAKQLQVLHLRKGQGIEKIVNPPMVADITLKNQPASLLPGGVTFLPTTSGVGFKPAYEVNPDVLQAITPEIAETQNRIKAALYEDLWMMISSLDTVRSATEVAERKEEKMQMLGPALERLHDELLSPAIYRTLSIIDRARMLPPMPESIKGMSFKIQYTSIMAQAQKAVGTTAIERTFAFAGNMAAVDPNVMDNLNVDVALNEYAQDLGTPPTIMRSADQVTAIRTQKAKAAQAQQQSAQSLAAVQGAKTLSETETGAGQNALQRMIGVAA